MSGAAQWLFQKEREAISQLVTSKLARTGIVQAVSGGRITVTDPLTGGNETELLSVLGPVPLVGERVAIIPLADGSRLATSIGVSTARIGVENNDVAVNTPRILDFSNRFLVSADSPEETRIEADPAYLMHTFLPYGGAGGYSLGGTRALYYTTTQPLGALTGVTLTANRLYYIPIWLGHSFTTAGYIFEVTTALSGSVQCGIFDCASLSFLPNNRLALSTKTSVTTTGVKIFANGTAALTRGQWVFVGICSTTAMALKGSVTPANLPSQRGGSDQDGATVYMIASEDLTAGWTNLPTSASAGSRSNTYLHVGVTS